MEIEQLELDLWSTLATAVKYPQTADLRQLCCALEREVEQQPMSQQLEIAAEGLQRLSQVYAARVELLLSEWERRYNPTEPVLDVDSCVGLFVQSLHLDVAELFEPAEPVYYPVQRQGRAHFSSDSLVGQVDKAALLSVVEQLPESQLLTEAEIAERLKQLAGEANVAQWSSAIAAWIQQYSRAQAVSLLRLQQVLEMPLIEVWLGLLSDGRQYEWQQQGDFHSEAREILVSL